MLLLVVAGLQFSGRSTPLKGVFCASSSHCRRSRRTRNMPTAVPPLARPCVHREFVKPSRVAIASQLHPPKTQPPLIFPSTHYSYTVLALYFLSCSALPSTIDCHLVCLMRRDFPLRFYFICQLLLRVAMHAPRKAQPRKTADTKHSRAGTPGMPTLACRT